MKVESNKTNNSADGLWVPFARFTTLEPSPNRNDTLVEGYCIPLDGKHFLIFVAKERENIDNSRGYFLKLMYEWGNDAKVDLDKQDEFPQAKRIFEDYLPDAWVNKGVTYHCYKYIIFGHGLTNKHLALSLMHSIIANIAK